MPKPCRNHDNPTKIMPKPCQKSCPQPASQPDSQPVSQPAVANQPMASQWPTSGQAIKQPASQSASQPARQPAPASQPANLLAQLHIANNDFARKDKVRPDREARAGATSYELRSRIAKGAKKIVNSRRRTAAPVACSSGFPVAAHLPRFA